MAKINSRAKGATAERELIGVLIEHLGDEIASKMKRNLEQTRGGGHDIDGLDGWAIEVKRYKAVKEGDIARFWEQTVDQARRIDAKPVLCYREDFRSWRVRLPMSFVQGLEPTFDETVEWTVELGIEAFAALVREEFNSKLARGNIEQP